MANLKKKNQYKKIPKKYAQTSKKARFNFFCLGRKKLIKDSKTLQAQKILENF